MNIRVSAKWGLVLGGGALFLLGRYFGSYDLVVARHAESTLHAEIVRLKAALGSSNQELIGLKQSATVDREAYGTVERDLREQQDEIAALRKEIEFYRAMVNVGDQSRGLRVQSFQIRGNEGFPEFSYRLILTQYMNGNRYVDGQIEMQIEGVVADKPLTIASDRLALSQASISRFHFKYFQELTGSMVLPEKFLPARILVRAKLEGKQREVVERTFPWEEVFRR